MVQPKVASPRKKEERSKGVAVAIGEMGKSNGGSYSYRCYG